MPRLHIDDRFHILDEHARTIVLSDVSVHDAHARLVLIADLDTALVAKSSTARIGVRESRQHSGQTTGPGPPRSDQPREVGRVPLGCNQDGAVVSKFATSHLSADVEIRDQTVPEFATRATRLDEILAEQNNTDPSMPMHEYWDRAHGKSISQTPGQSTDYTWYRIIPVVPGDADANTQLLAAALRRRWPTAAFTVMPTGDRSVSIRWIDGPSNFGVYAYCLHVAGSRGRFDSARYTRILTQHGWQSVAGLVEAWLPVTVPRTDSGEIDWLAAESIDLDGATLVAGHRVCPRPGLISVTLGEILRYLPDACDLADHRGPTIKPRYSEEPDVEPS